VPRLILEYDDDPIGAADALLAMLRAAVRRADDAPNPDEQNEERTDEAA
jgi:hypothetical protein